jgi:hypothetical protein
VWGAALCPRPRAKVRYGRRSQTRFREPAGLFHCKDMAHNALLYLLEGAYLDVADALAGHAEFGSELLQWYWLVSEAPRFENPAFAMPSEMMSEIGKP